MHFHAFIEIKKQKLKKKSEVLDLRLSQRSLSVYLFCLLGYNADVSEEDKFAACVTPISCLVYFSALKMEAVVPLKCQATFMRLCSVICQKMYILER
jgi:hypothetical protein